MHLCEGLRPRLKLFHQRPSLLLRVDLAHQLGKILKSVYRRSSQSPQTRQAPRSGSAPGMEPKLTETQIAGFFPIVPQNPEDSAHRALHSPAQNECAFLYGCVGARKSAPHGRIPGSGPRILRLGVWTECSHPCPCKAAGRVGPGDHREITAVQGRTLGVCVPPWRRAWGGRIIPTATVSEQCKSSCLYQPGDLRHQRII